MPADMSEIPKDLKYTSDHEWMRRETDGTCLIGITHHAQESLGDVTFVELPAVGDSFEAGAACGVVESVKAASDLYLPVEGEITEVNETLIDSPEKVNEDPYGTGWMMRVRPGDPAEIEKLLSPTDYRQLMG